MVTRDSSSSASFTELLVQVKQAEDRERALIERVVELQADLEGEREQRLYFEQSNAMLQQRVKTLEADIERLTHILRDDSVHKETREHITKLERQLDRERDVAARERACLNDKTRELQQRMDTLLKNTSAVQTGGGPDLEDGRIDFSMRSPKPQERPRSDDIQSHSGERSAMTKVNFDRSRAREQSPEHFSHQAELDTMQSPRDASPIPRLQTPSPLTPENAANLVTQEQSEAAAASSPGSHQQRSPKSAANSDRASEHSDTEIAVDEPQGDEKERGVSSKGSRADNRRESTSKAVVLEIPRQVGAPPSSPGERVASETCSEVLSETRPRRKEEEGDMLIAAAVTMAPPEERAEFLFTLSDKERAGALRWMDPQDLAEALELCIDCGKFLQVIPLTGSCFSLLLLPLVSARVVLPASNPMLTSPDIGEMRQP